MKMPFISSLEVKKLYILFLAFLLIIYTFLLKRDEIEAITFKYIPYLSNEVASGSDITYCITYKAVECRDIS